eukprot:743465-Amorphochlora_amoeboformis.AAC.1
MATLPWESLGVTRRDVTLCHLNSEAPLLPGYYRILPDTTGYRVLPQPGTAATGYYRYRVPPDTSGYYRVPPDG